MAKKLLGVRHGDGGVEREDDRHGAAGCGRARARARARAAAAAGRGRRADRAVAPIRPAVLGSRPHDPRAYTQGLLLYKGRLFESTGLYGGSSLREVDAKSGRAPRQVDLGVGLFAEGLAVVPNIYGGEGDHLVQLTWQEREALVYDPGTFAAVGSFAYTGEGWGLCFDGRRLVMSDGSSRSDLPRSDHLRRRWQRAGDARRATARSAQRARVRQRRPVGERVDDGPRPAHRSHERGSLLRRSISRLLTPTEAAAAEVLNGIAHLGGDRFLITGKNWPKMFEVELVAR